MPRLTSFYFLFVLAHRRTGTTVFPLNLFDYCALKPNQLGITALAGAVLSAAYMLSFTAGVFRPCNQNPLIGQDLRRVNCSVVCTRFVNFMFGFFLIVCLKQSDGREAWLTVCWINRYWKVMH